ncbi:MAG: prepilin-type N-terminal cleavage/methylation domain-containing protein [Trueperaceae bacterium]|nr:prepilin-type N-terminal cleavage/methylation domain-containing protein [Trueperaceae bacterium]
MQNTSPTRFCGGFSLIEVIMAVLVVAVLASVLIPNLLVSRQRAFDAQTQACLKELNTQHLVAFTEDFEYTSLLVADYPPSCNGVNVTEVTMTPSYYEYTAQHPQSPNIFATDANSGVENVTP